ncbi:hypothetical protein MIND_00870800 [Mycena indigotica]|uniref:Uncharacterized protein n=1 Tax=Mycena indigotica TaxID=2126181 RepID=A0A8H6W164_9AGAR|nr:uncharacterized protein MIND_00870800 [Mycena indigotica]KAF7299221.1 hypothetical protein MIND_00870800 [Mycena indigotica]
MPIDLFNDASLNFLLDPPASSHTISSSGKQLSLKALPSTDWWRIPGTAEQPNGVENRDGALFARPIDATRDFVAGVWIRGAWGVQYDQGCLMIITSATGTTGNWVKAGVELEDGKEFVSAVVTTPWSDWSIEPATISTSTSGSSSAGAIYIQISRQGPHLTVKKYLSSSGPSDSVPNETELVKYREVHGFDLNEAGKARASPGDVWRVGCMVCGPKNESGTEAEFFNFSFQYL